MNPTPASINPDSIAEQWQLPPVALAWPCRHEGPSAAAYAGHARRALDLGVAPDASTHVLTVISRCFDVEVAIDDRNVFAGTLSRGAVQFLQGGRRPHARLAGRWSFVHLYLPARDLCLLAEDMGHASTTAGTLEIADPLFRQDALLTRIGLELERRMRGGERPSRLELDELVLRVGERLLRRFASTPPPRRRKQPALSCRERMRVTELLGDAHQPGMAELSAELGRSELDTLAAFERAFRAAPLDVQAALLSGRGS